MPWKSLLTQPLCRAEDLGKPIPPTTHAVSMCLPRWRDVVGYEERNPETMAHLWVGYPRFLYHPLVERAFDAFRLDPVRPVQIYTTRAAAERCRSYLLKKNPDAEVEVQPIDQRNEAAIVFPETCAADAKDYWQHAGEGISSRAAEDLLELSTVPTGAPDQNEILERLSAFSGVPTEHIYLFPSGMAAIHGIFLAVRKLFADRPTVQFAFPYGDTLKLQQKLGEQPPLFYARGDAEDLDALEQVLKDRKIGGLFCEFPTNPLLSCVDLHRLRAMADEHHFPILLDETLGACINLDVRAYADVSIISLTKFFSGSSDVMGGAVLIHPDAPFADQITAALKYFHEPAACHPADLARLITDSTDCRERVERINKSTRQVCEFLMSRDEVETVYYPACTDKELYDRIKKPGGGYGGLLSFVLRDAPTVTETFYDALEISKGPNLGTRFSLCCPFTLIAHYNELDWAESAGASRWLIRISIGLEPAEELIARIARALNKTNSS